MENNFKTLYVNSLSQFVGKNITRNAANSLYNFIKENAANIEEVKSISVDDNKVSSKYGVKFLGGISGVQVYQHEVTGNIILKKVNINKVLKVGTKIKDKFGKLVTILEVDAAKEDSINQKVVYQHSRGAIIQSVKWQLLGL